MFFTKFANILEFFLMTQQYLVIYLYSVNYIKLQVISFRVLKFLNMFFIYPSNKQFCKFFFFVLKSLNFYKLTSCGNGQFSLLKSPHVNKKAQSQFLRLYYKSILQFKVTTSYETFMFYFLLTILNKILQIKSRVFYLYRYKYKKFNLYSSFHNND
jgi:hypothetical protein